MHHGMKQSPSCKAGRLTHRIYKVSAHLWGKDLICITECFHYAQVEVSSGPLYLIFIGFHHVQFASTSVYQLFARENQ